MLTPGVSGAFNVNPEDLFGNIGPLLGAARLDEYVRPLQDLGFDDASDLLHLPAQELLLVKQVIHKQAHFLRFNRLLDDARLVRDNGAPTPAPAGTRPHASPRLQRVYP